jgi:hypothetical protein
MTDNIVGIIGRCSCWRCCSATRPACVSGMRHWNRRVRRSSWPVLLAHCRVAVLYGAACYTPLAGVGDV